MDLSLFSTDTLFDCSGVYGITLIVLGKVIWFGLVLWHINHCKLFIAKYRLYIFITYV